MGGGYGMAPGYGMGGGYGMMGPGYNTGQQQVIAGALGITPEALITARQSGKSVAAIAQEQGVDLQKVIDAVIAPMKATLSAQVSAGRITQSHADWMLTEMQEHVRTQFTDPSSWGSGMWRADYYGSGMLDRAAGMMNQTRQGVMRQLAEGKSIAAMMQERGIDPESGFIGPLLAEEQAQLQAQIAAGALTPEQASEIITQRRDGMRSRIHTPGTGIGEPNPIGGGPYGPGMGPGRGYAR
jgi:hypothetical protein